MKKKVQFWGKQLNFEISQNYEKKHRPDFYEFQSLLSCQMTRDDYLSSSTWGSVKADTPSCSSSSRKGVFPTFPSLHQILFTFPASPRAATGCVSQTTQLSPITTKGNQPHTHLRASIQFPYPSWMDDSSTHWQTERSEWNLSTEEEKEEEFLFFL